MARKESTVVYDKHVEICAEYLTDEQFGRLMFALIKGEDPDFGDDPLLALAFRFISLQKDLDDKKYEERCKQNRENGRKGGRPKKGEEKPKKPKGFLENPNDNDNEKDKDKDKVNDEDSRLSGDNRSGHAPFLSLGSFNNVHLTDTELTALRKQYEHTNALIEKVSVWIRTAKHDVPDHYALCVKFANNDDWPRRRQIEPVEEITVQDPLSEEEQQQKVLEMRARLNGALAEG